MKTEEKRKYCKEQFRKLLPSLNLLIHSVRLTNTIEKYTVNSAEFLIRLNKDVVEMSRASEKPIFPTLAYRQTSDTVADLLYYRIGDDFANALYKATY